MDVWLITIAIALLALAVALIARHRHMRLPVHVQGLAGPLDVYDTEWEDGRPVRVLASGATLESAVYLDERPFDPVFEYYVLFDLMFEGARPVTRALLMGGGGYAYPRYLLHTHPEVRLDVVELDPVVTRLARRYLGLRQLEREVGTGPRGRLGLHEGDARSFLEHTDERYDAILNDCFSGDMPAPTLATLEAARLVHSRLQPRGLFLANVVSPLEGPDAALLRSLARTLRQEFGHVYVVPGGRNPSDAPDNNLLVACDAPFDFPAARVATWTREDPLITDGSNPTEVLAQAASPKR